MNKVVTLITIFNEQTLDKIKNLVCKYGLKTCKVPFGVTESNREQNDGLPFHFTISAWDEKEENKVIEILNNIELKPINVFIDNVEIKNGQEDSYVLYLLPQNDKKLKNILQTINKQLPSEKYNPSTFTFHITLDVDKSIEKIEKLKNNILKSFKPFHVTINKLGLFKIYPPIMIYEKRATKNDNC
jgi:2'-5' RNA ligase